jgi:hypothetical protein
MFRSFQNFVLFIQHAPLTLQTLLDAETINCSDHLDSKLVRWYSLLSQRDVNYYRQHSCLQNNRLLELAIETDLPLDLAQLPIQLFHRYNSQFSNIGPSEQPFSEEEIRYEPTFGDTPINHCFLIGNSVHRFNAVSGFITAISFSDNRLHAACVSYLKSLGYDYLSFEQFRRVVCGVQ